ncbi:MAG TPA: hypothetical protein VFH51_12110 [Myxococcota bacterium]|nr:hypothetical protein [Myxococcota bacterium]
MAGKPRTKVREAMDNPLEGEDLLLDAMFGETPAPTTPGRVRPPVGKPEHYKVVSISLYVEDIERLNAYVRELKRRGHYKANKSQIIRQALAQLDLDRVPKSD